MLYEIFANVLEFENVVLLFGFDIVHELNYFQISGSKTIPSILKGIEITMKDKKINSSSFYVMYASSTPPTLPQHHSPAHHQHPTKKMKERTSKHQIFVFFNYQ